MAPNNSVASDIDADTYRFWAQHRWRRCSAGRRQSIRIEIDGAWATATQTANPHVEYSASLCMLR